MKAIDDLVNFLIIDPLDEFEFYRRNNRNEKKDLIYDIYSDKNNFYIDIELPGIKKEDISLKYDKDSLILTISSKNEEKNKEDIIYYIKKRKKIENKIFKFSLKMEILDIDNIKVKYSDGLLSIEIPKINKEKSYQKEIKIM